MVRTSGALESTVGLPTESGGTQFDKKLQAVVTKEPGGGYEVEDQSGETDTSLAFDKAGKVKELQTPGYAKIDYSYEAGNLSEMAVEDPATFPAPKQEAEVPTYQSSLGAEGTGNGQFKHPADLAIDAKRNIWVADQTNNRIEEFDGAGAFVKTFGWGVSNGENKLQVCTTSCLAGKSGSGNGQFTKPTAIAVDPEGNIWVADWENCRIERFNPAGAYLSKLDGTCSFESGKFWTPEGLAIDSAGNVYVASSLFGGASRVQKFNAKGEFVKLIAGEGTGNGQVKYPAGLAFDPSGNLWVADRNNNRVEEFSAAGEYVRQWKGSGAAAFKPFAIDVDASGTVWVGDTEHNRVEGFNQYGDLLTSFGSEGSGEGQFKLGAPVGLVADLVGDVWVTDSTNQRVEQWIPSKEMPPAPQEGDPNVEVNVSSGLVTSVEGEEAGKTTYSHTGETLTAVTGPKGKVSYEYDEAKRLKKVSLPKGTWGEVKYDAYGRVESVTVSVEGAKAKTTHFAYKDEPRRTTVSPEGAPITVYDIAPDGSVLKWWNKQEPPEIENLSGSLYANKETSEPITSGDYELLVQAHSVEGIASIEIVANGNQLVDEKTCEQDYKKEGTECQTVEDPWVTETGNWPPGILYLEVIVTSSVEKTETVPNTESAKFWVNIPYTPPPDPEADEPPKFEEVLHFREEFGLDLDLKGNEIAIDERIFNLIGSWYNPQTPAGEVARATDERWGVPLRAVDAAELEYREQYLAHDVPQLDEWARANLSGTYAGAYVDERSGGLIRLGFTADQVSSIVIAKQGTGLIAPDRVAGFTSVPTHSLEALQSVENEVNSAVPSLPASLIVSFGIDTEANSVAVGATNVEEASVDLKNILGQQAPILIEFEEGSPVEMSTRAKISGPILAGDYLLTPTGGTCSAGYGAFQKLSTGIKRLFLLTAAHCSNVGENMRRENSAGQKASIGVTKRSGKDSNLGELIADGEAIALNGALGAPRYINQGRKGPIAVKSIATIPGAGKHLCHAGYGSDPLGNAPKPLCGKVRDGRYFILNKSPKKVEVLFCFEAGIHGGDSGGPVWIQGSHTAVGLATNGRGKLGKESYRETCATALLLGELKPGEAMPPNTAILSNQKMAPLQLSFAP